MRVDADDRDVFAPNIDPAVFPFHVILKSIHNTVIEGFWRRFLEKLGINLKDFLLQGRERHLFDPNVPFHTCVYQLLAYNLKTNLYSCSSLFYWIFVPFSQAEMDDFSQWWNNHQVRKQTDKNMPSGVSPNYAMQNPRLLCGLDCRIPVPKEAVAILREYLNEEEGPREDHLAWVSQTFDQAVWSAYEIIQSPPIDVHSAWDVFG